MQYDTPYRVLAVWIFVNGERTFPAPEYQRNYGGCAIRTARGSISKHAFLGNTGMVISMTLALPLLITTIPLDIMMNMFVVCGMNMPMETQITFTHGIAFVLLISSLLTVPAIIVSVLRGSEDAGRHKERTDRN